ncbi:unnamed protein product [Rhizophagus irregularis]|nr:unnamed protein product [Rhizophagus irregularis]CAB4413870.1 unnamed protein product [Rhizophagus irregularis]
MVNEACSGRLNDVPQKKIEEVEKTTVEIKEGKKRSLEKEEARLWTKRSSTIKLSQGSVKFLYAKRVSLYERNLKKGQLVLV